MASSPTPSARAGVADPILRNALRYTVSAREYATLHKYILSRSRVLKRNAPSVETVTRIVNGPPPKRASAADADAEGADGAPGVAKTKKKKAAAGNDPLAPTNDYNVRAVRHAIRVFVATGIGMKAWGLVVKRLMGANAKVNPTHASNKKEPFYNSPTFRLSLSLSSILFLYRLLFRFFTRLRFQILDPAAEPFRRRNPRTASTLTSPYAPAIGASLAGLALGVYPAQQLRVSIAIYTLFRALEFGWNCAEEGGMIWGWEKDPRMGGGGLRKRERPWWWGSWMIQPFAFGQLLHAVVFDRDCFPDGYGDFIFKRSDAYIQKRPAEYPRNLRWPSTYEIVDSLAAMAKLHWPPFVSPTLFPDKQNTLPAGLEVIAPITNRAHPLITSLSCATLHPQDPSCARTYLTFWLRSFPPTARLFLAIYSAFALPQFRKLYHSPATVLRSLVARALRTTTFLTGAMSTAWVSICMLQAWLPRGALATQRFFLGGFVAGFWAWVERKRGRGIFLYSARTSVDSLWKVGVKRRWWKAMKGGDVWVFVLAVMLTGVVYERDTGAIKETSWRRGVSWVRGEGFRDWAIEEEDDDEDNGEAQQGLIEDGEVVLVDKEN